MSVIGNFVAYVKQSWANKPNTSTPISAERLTHMEDGIGANSNAVVALDAELTKQKSDFTELEKSFKEFDGEYLLLDGSKQMKGPLRLKTGGMLDDHEEASYLSHLYNGVEKYISISAKLDDTNCLRFIHNGVRAYKVFGEYNKPSGSYVGNGSATERVINIGGFGKVLHISSGDIMVIVDSGGAIVKPGNSAPYSLGPHVFSFAEGKLKIATTDTHVNGNGWSFFYDLL